MQKFKTRLSLLVAFFLVVIAAHAQLSGPTGTVNAGQTATYTYNDGTVYGYYSFYGSNANATLLSSSSSGTTYTATFQWVAPGAVTISFSGYGQLKSSLSVTVACPTVATPNATFSYSGGCSTETISYTQTPPANTTWYWQTSSTGTSTANSTNSNSVSASGTYYIRPLVGSSCWGTAQATSSITVTTPVTPSVSLTATPSTQCQGSSVTLYATPTNATSPTYNFYIDGTSVQNGSTASYPTTTLTAGSHSAYVVMTSSGCVTTTTATSTTQSITINSQATPTAGFTITQTAPYCSGTYSSLNLNYSGTSGSSYTWTVNGATLPSTVSQASFNSPAGTYTISVTANGISGCYNATSATYTNASSPLVVTQTLTPSVSLSVSNTTLCQGAKLSLTASPTNGGSTPTYNFYIDGISVQNTSSATYSSTTVSPGAHSTYVIMTSSIGSCLSSATGQSSTQNFTIVGTPAAPTVPTWTSVNGGCGPQQATETGSAPTGVTWYWQSVSNGTSTTSPATVAYPVPSSATIYVNGVTTTGSCWGPASSVAVTANALPQDPNLTATFGVTNQCGQTVVSVSGTIPGGQNWYWEPSSSGTTIGPQTANAQAYTGYSAGTIYVRALNASNNCWSTNSASTSFSVNLIPTISSSVTPVNAVICPTGQATITVSNPNAVPGTTYSWSVAQGTNVSGASTPIAGSTSTTQTLNNTGNTQSTSTYTITPSANGCPGTPATVVVYINPLPTISLNNLSPTLCSTASTNIIISNPNTVAGTTYTWTATPSNVLGSANQGTGTTSTNIAQALTSQTGNTAGSVSYTITASATFSSVACSASTATTVTVNPVPVASASNQTVFVGNPTSVAISSNVTGTTYSYTAGTISNITNAAAGTANPIAQSLSVTDGVNPGSVVYSIVPAAAGCAGAAKQVTISLYPQPIITASTAIVYMGSTSNLQAQSFYDTYNWSSTSGAIAGANSITVSKVDTYTLSVIKNGVTSSVTATYKLNGQFAGQNQNYIVANSLLISTSDTTRIKYMPVDSVAQSIQYFDGLGKPTQAVVTQGSPSRMDIVQPTVYDTYFREYRKYLPFTSSNNGWYKTDPVGAISGNYATSLQYLFYNNGTVDKIVDDVRPFTETIFEPSPLNRPSQDYSTGQNWKTNLKFIGHGYYSNIDGTAAGQEKVIAWVVDAKGYPRKDSITNTSITNGYHNSNQLTVKSTVDEQGHEVREYVDKLGRTILKKVQAVDNAVSSDTTNQWTPTYYIYDDFGLLRYVLQPELARKMQALARNPSTSDLSKLAFQYQYDGRKRMIQKQVPGAGPVYMVYDDRDRLVLTQDANQRSGSTYYWTFTKYDILNRSIATGIKDTSVLLTQAQMQSVVNAHYMKTSSQWGETFIGTSAANNLHGYTNKSYPVITGSTAGEKDPNKYLTITYYDNYTFRNDWPTGYTYSSDLLTSGNYTQVATGSENNRVIGHLTGSKTKVLDGGVTGGYTWLKSIVYYDDKYRTIQTLSDNYKAGTDRISNVLDFAGKVLKTKTTHSESDVLWVNRVGASAASLIGNILIAAGASSSQILAPNVDGWMEFVVSELNSTRLIGLNSSDPDVSANIQYAFKLVNNVLYVVENNGSPYATVNGVNSGDVLRIQRIGTTIHYYRNGVEIPISPASTASTTQLLVDTFSGTGNATFVGVRTSFSTTSHTITRRFDYDHASRLIRTWHQTDSSPEVLLTLNAYNEIGQLVDKKLHSSVADGSDNKQSVDYRYNIRGWLTTMNNSQLANDAGVTNDDNNDYFGMNLLYEQGDTNLGSSGLYNGNISGMKWSSNLGQATIKETGFNFNYDPLNRLLNANPRMNSGGTWQAGYYGETGLQYDLNGNIKNLTRTGDAGNQIDQLVYNYGSFGNQLQYVQDYAPAATRGLGFNDGNSGTGQDYTYDVNGNMTRDLNKGIGTSITDATGLISYNFLNLPEKVVGKGGPILRYVYDATGRKLTKVEDFIYSQNPTDYVGEFIYENDALQFINHDEGRIVVDNTKLIYSNHCDVVSADMTLINVSTQTYTNNGQNYIKATSTSTASGTGIFPIGGTFTVQPGDVYRVRAKGYRTGDNVYLQVKMGTTVINDPGARTNRDFETWTEQIVTVPPGVTTMQAGLIWRSLSVGEVLTLNEFEISKLTTTTPEYQYHLKDHLGNVRLTFTTLTTTNTFTAGFETTNQTAEAAYFTSGSYQTSKISTVASFATTPTNSYYLNGGATGIVGPTKTLSVMPGDQVSISAAVKYLAPTATASNVSANLLPALLAAFNLPTPAAGETGTPGSGVKSFSTWETGASGDENKSDAIKAFVTIVLFDRNYNLLDVTYQAVLANGTMSASYIVKQPGYAYLYFSNEHSTLTDMYFDNVAISYTPSAIVQQQDFYPFGLKFNSYSRESSVPNNMKLFQGQEHVDDLGLNWDSFKWRNHQPDIGRFFNIDPLAEKYVYNSTYAFSENKVTAHVELEGLESIPAPLAKELGNLESTWNNITYKVDQAVESVKGSVSNAFSFLSSDKTAAATGDGAGVVESFSKSPTVSNFTRKVGMLADVVEMTEKTVQIAQDKNLTKQGKVAEVTQMVGEKVATIVGGKAHPVLGAAFSVLAADGKDKRGVTQNLKTSYGISGGQMAAMIAARVNNINNTADAEKAKQKKSNQSSGGFALKE